MRLLDFITANIEPILAEWVAFARTRLPAAGDMNYLALRNDAEQILKEIAEEMLRPQGEVQRLERSQGLAIRDPVLAETPSRAHAMHRVRSGFEINQMVAEFRALRATVLRLWKASLREVNVNDVEDIMRFNEAVDQALAESLKFFVAEVDRARNLFLGVLGHDLRTPLGTIMSCAQYQLRIVPEGVQANMILRNAAHMKALVDDLLSYTRNRLGVGVTIEPARIDLAQFVRDTLEEIIAINPKRVIALTVEGNLQGVWDARRLHQVLSNLVVNALKYGALDTPIKVTLDGTRLEEVVLAVHNFGIPIPAALLPDLFEPLVRGSAQVLAPQPSGASMGLGLYIARDIVIAHGGTIGVTSSHGDGTRFKVQLPREAV